MSVIVIDPTARNLPEQVLKNTQEIAELQSAIDELAKDLPDIMGRSPALYKEVVSLTTPEAPTGSFNLDFSKTSYNVKNGDFVFAVFSNGATFNSYIGLLSVTNDTAGSGIYSASVLSVTPNLRGNNGATGPAGQPGEAGADGKDALWCNTIITGSEPLQGGTCILDSSYFNRTPENGEKFLALWQNTNDENHPYFVNLQIASDASPYTCNILYVSDIKGATGPAGETQLLYIGPNIGSAVNTNPDTVVGGTIASLSRKPVVGERFLMPVEVGATGASDKIIMIVYVEVTSVGSVSPTWSGKIVAGANSVPVSISQSANPSVSGHQNNIFNVKNTFRFVYQDAQFRTKDITFGIPLKATNGIVADVSEDGKFIELSAKLYRHRIKINATAGLFPEIYTEIINASETPFDMDSLTSLIEGKQQVANGIATGTQPLFENSVVYIYSNNSVLYARTANLSNVALVRQNTAITDTVEEI